MSFVILPLNRNDRAPRAIRVLLVCDGPHQFFYPLLPRETATYFDYPYVKRPHWRTQAARAGWRFLENGKIHGPCCPEPFADRRTIAKYLPRSSRRPRAPRAARSLQAPDAGPADGGAASGDG